MRRNLTPRRCPKVLIAVSWRAGLSTGGLLDENGEPIAGYGLDDCIYVNGDFIHKEVEWIDAGSDLAKLAGKVVQVVFRTRGTKLYSMQFE